MPKLIYWEGGGDTEDRQNLLSKLLAKSAKRKLKTAQKTAGSNKKPQNEHTDVSRDHKKQRSVEKLLSTQDAVVTKVVKAKKKTAIELLQDSKASHEEQKKKKKKVKKEKGIVKPSANNDTTDTTSSKPFSMPVKEATSKWGLDPDVAGALEQQNIHTFFPIQCQAIPVILRSLR